MAIYLQGFPPIKHMLKSIAYPFRQNDERRRTKDEG